MLERSSLDLKDSIVIFDEAHNIDSLCEQGSDIHLTLDLLSLVMSELKLIVKYQSSKNLHPQFNDRLEERQLTIEFKAQI